MLAIAMLGAAGCVRFNNPEGWAGPTVADDLLVVSTDQGELSALDPIAEFGAQCDNASDDDQDGWVNEGCPRVGAAQEKGDECDNSTNDDTADGAADDDKVNDGCPLSSLWTFPTGDEEPELDLEAIYGTPLIINSTVYFAAYSGEVFALSLVDGRVLWTSDTGEPIIAGLAISETAVYVATDGGLLYALDPQTGAKVMTPFDAGDSIWATPLLAEGVLYVASINGKLTALDAETLKPVWASPFETGHGLISDPVLAGDTVLVGGIDRALHAVDAGTGEERWFFKADNWFWGRPLVVDGTVYAPNLDGRLYALDLENGGERWSFPAEEPLRSAPLLAGEALVIVDRKGNAYGLDPSAGTLVWSGPAALEETVLSNPMVFDDAVLISAEGGDLFRLDPAAGSFVEVPTR